MQSLRFRLELAGKLIRNGFQPIEIDIRYNSRSFEEGKKVSILGDPPTGSARHPSSVFSSAYLAQAALNVENSAIKLDHFREQSFPVCCSPFPAEPQGRNVPSSTTGTARMRMRFAWRFCSCFWSRVSVRGASGSSPLPSAPLHRLLVAFPNKSYFSIHRVWCADFGAVGLAKAAMVKLRFNLPMGQSIRIVLYERICGAIGAVVVGLIATLCHSSSRHQPHLLMFSS